MRAMSRADFLFHRTRRDVSGGARRQTCLRGTRGEQPRRAGTETFLDPLLDVRRHLGVDRKIAALERGQRNADVADGLALSPLLSDERAQALDLLVDGPLELR